MIMSFSSEVKAELAANISTSRHCQLAELAAFFCFLGRVEESENGGLRLGLQTENAAVQRKCFTLLKKTFNIVTDVSIRRNSYLKKNRTYSVVVNDHQDTIRVLQAAKLIGADGEIEENLSLQKNMVVKHTCCRRAFIRGAFLAAGSISDPEKSYHFEITCATEEKARQLRGIIGTFGLDAKIVVRKKYFVVYMKEGCQIVDMLNVMEAPVALMDLENIRILKEMRGQVNRQVNCETANIHKTVSAAVKQLRDIEYIRDTTGLATLPERLEEIARARLEKPEATLKELGEELDPPVGKSGVNHRLRKLSEIASAMRAEEECHPAEEKK